MTEGTCLCGALRYAVDAPFHSMLHCHCSMCRKHHGAAFATFVAGPFDAFRWLAGDEDVARYPSSAQGVRAYCRHCGSVAPLLLPDHGLALCPAGNLAGELGIRPQQHIFVAAKAPWHAITDDLPQHQGYPPEFGGGSGLERPPMPHRAGAIGGSCLCGEVAYEVDEPQRMVHCHCSRCRRGRSAAHTTNVFAPLAGFRWLRGEELIAQYKVPDARYFAVTFCTRCGAEVPRVAHDRGLVVIPAGGLDTDPGIRPEAHIFVGSKASWFEITDGLPQHEAMPAA